MQPIVDVLPEGPVLISDFKAQVYCDRGRSPGQSRNSKYSKAKSICDVAKATVNLAGFDCVWIQVPDQEGVPDGLTVDRDGYLMERAVGRCKDRQIRSSRTAGAGNHAARNLPDEFYICRRKSLASERACAGNRGAPFS